MAKNGACYMARRRQWNVCVLVCVRVYVERQRVCVERERTCVAIRECVRVCVCVCVCVRVKRESLVCLR